MRFGGIRMEGDCPPEFRDRFIHSPDSVQRIRKIEVDAVIVRLEPYGLPKVDDRFARVPR